MYIGIYFTYLYSYNLYFCYDIELLQKLRLFVKAKQVTKHCLEKEKVPLNYDPAEFDGTVILSAQSPTLKRYPSTTLSSTTSTTGKNPPSIQKDFMCSIWLV